jgi:hypothetical protein
MTTRQEHCRLSLSGSDNRCGVVPEAANHLRPLAFIVTEVVLKH